jgi:hypothetical protein
MISYFQDGLKQSVPSKSLSFDELVELIKFNLKKDIISEVRELKKNKDQTYRHLKSIMPIVTPNCTLLKRRLAGKQFEKNFGDFSGYLYYDFDNTNEGFKDYFINRYRDHVALVAKSIGGDGISVLVKVDEQLTKQNFKGVWSYIKNSVFKDEIIDSKCSDIGRSWFVTWDEDVFVNHSSQVTIDLSGIKLETENAIQGKVLESGNYILNCTKTVNINVVLNSLKFQSTIPVDNNVLDFKPEEYCKVFVPKTIPDEKKRYTYRSIIHNLVYLNPDANPNYIFSFLTYVNRQNAKPSMNYKELKRYFTMIYIKIRETDDVQPITKIKKVHFNVNCGYTRLEKIRIANRINGLFRRKQKIELINNAIIEIQTENRKVTSKELAEITGIKLRTVQLLLKIEPFDFEEELRKINQTI